MTQIKLSSLDIGKKVFLALSQYQTLTYAIYKNICTKVGLLLKPRPRPWTWTLKNLDFKNPGP